METETTQSARMRTAAPIAGRFFWNLLLLAAAAWCIWRIGPKIVRQFQGVPWESKLAPEIVPRGVEAIGALLALWFLLASLGTWTWSRISTRARVAWTLIAGVLLLSTAVCAGIDLVVSEFRMPTWLHDYFAYAITVALTAFPVSAFGTGYIGLVRAIWQRTSSRRL